MSTLIGANIEFDLVLEGITSQFAFDITSADILKGFEFKCSDSSIQSKICNKFESLIGAKFYSSNENTLDDIYSILIFHHALEKIFFFYNPTYSDLSKEACRSKMICRCFGVSENEILEAIKTGGADLLSITNLTKASGGCGSCKSDVKNLISYSKHNVIVNENHFDSSFYAALTSKFAKYPRELINGKQPLIFLNEDIRPLAKKNNFEILGLVEKNLYIKSKDTQVNLEEYLKSKDLDISIFYS